MKSIKKVAFVELQPTYPHIGSYMICPTYGPILLATILNHKGYKADVYVEGITKIEQDVFNEYDVICFSIQTPTANKSYKLAKQLKKNDKIKSLEGRIQLFFQMTVLNIVIMSFKEKVTTLCQTYFNALNPKIA